MAASYAQVGNDWNTIQWEKIDYLTGLGLVPWYMNQQPVSTGPTVAGTAVQTTTAPMSSPVMVTNPSKTAAVSAPKPSKRPTPKPQRSPTPKPVMITTTAGMRCKHPSQSLGTNVHRA